MIDKGTLKREKYLLLTVSLISAAVFILSLRIGAYPLTFRDIAGVISGKATGSMAGTVFFGLRLPRVVTAALAGAVLSVTGAVYQTVFRTALASPDLTGVASGASLGTALAVIFFGAGQLARITLSFSFGMLSLFLMLFAVRMSGGERRTSYILAGIVISSIVDAVLMFLKAAADPEKELSAIEYFTMGSLGSVTFEKMLYLLILALPALVILLIFRRETVMLSLGSQQARSLGLSPGRWRWILLSLSTFAVAAVVSVTGVISFAGLTAPHISLLLYKRRSGGYFAFSALVGACFLMTADIFARSVVSGAELPVSIFTVAFSSPVLFILLCRRGKTEQ